MTTTKEFLGYAAVAACVLPNDAPGLGPTVRPGDGRWKSLDVPGAVVASHAEAVRRVMVYGAGGGVRDIEIVKVYRETTTTEAVTDRRIIDLGGPVPAGYTQIGYAQVRGRGKYIAYVSGIFPEGFTTSMFKSAALVFPSLDDLANAVRKRNQIRDRSTPDAIDPRIVVEKIITPAITDAKITIERF